MGSSKPNWTIVFRALEVGDYVIYHDQLWWVYERNTIFIPFSGNIRLTRQEDLKKEYVSNSNIKNIKKANFVDLWELKRNSK